MPIVPQIRYLKSKNGNERIPVRLQEQNLSVAKFWHNNVQLKFINNLKDRADIGWNWVNKYKRIKKAISFLPGPAEEYVFEGKAGSSGWYPLSMISIRNPIPALHDNRKDSVYLWFLSTAPDSILRRWFGSKTPGRVGQASVEMVVTLSLAKGYRGLLGLHASPKGKKLRDFYGITLGLDSLNSNVSIPWMIAQPTMYVKYGHNTNDGRYFYADEQVSASVRAAFDSYR